MTFDLQDIESRISEGIYGDDRMTNTGRDDAFAALAVLLDEVDRLRAKVVAERAAVVAFLREQAGQWDRDAAGWAALNHASVMVERGLHRPGLA
jgi:nuclear transport factor 2 (NTF2) superfamily protein